MFVGGVPSGLPMQAFSGFHGGMGGGEAGLGEMLQDFSSVCVVLLLASRGHPATTGGSLMDCLRRDPLTAELLHLPVPVSSGVAVLPGLLRRQLDPLGGPHQR